jgi:hypothetical protein
VRGGLGRCAIGVAAIVALLTACTGTSTTNGRPATSHAPTALATDTAHLTAYCAGLAAAAAKITAAEVAMYGGTANAGAAPLIAELKALQANAPADIKAALTDLITGFTTAQDLLAHPTQQNKAQIEALAPKLAADGQKISAYIVSQCPAR